jgi:predicted transcriptional regulator
MIGSRFNRDKNIETIVNDLLKSRARSKIYIFLLRKKGAKTEDIIKGTKLHPSTVRETLSKMYEQRQIFRKKMKNDSIGKNPYIYYPVPPIQLLKIHAKDIEDRLNRIANLGSKNKLNGFKTVKIKINEEAGQV